MKKSLVDTNPYLKNAEKRKDALTRNVETSSAIEGILIRRDAKTGKFSIIKETVKAHAKATKTSR